MMGALGDHLWQSTLFAAAIALLALALRRNRPHVRHWLWLAASVKFLVPFAALVTLGSRFELGADVASPDLARAIGVVSQPFADGGIRLVEPVSGGAPLADAANPLSVDLLIGIWALGAMVLLTRWVRRWRQMAAVVRAASPTTWGREVDTLRRLERAAGVTAPIALVTSPGPFEPGIFGIVRPVLLWPHSIAGRLDDAQIEAIVAHEVAHVRRRDNLSAALHMVVQSLFWFHPLVWWLGARLVDERERACDREVIRLGSEPGVDAAGILQTARFCVESPLRCTAGVTGADLGRRIEAIMRRDFGTALSASRKALLAATAIGAVTGPLAAGLFSAQQPLRPEPVSAATPRFATVSIKPNRSEDFGSVRMPPGAFLSSHTPIRVVIELAYGIEARQLIGGPEWIGTDPFAIEAKASGAPAPDEIRAMVRALLHDRFGLRARVEARELPVFALVPVRGGAGSALAPLSAAACAAAAPQAPGPNALPPCGMVAAGHGRLQGRAVTMTQLARALSRAPGVDRLVIDRTALPAEYQFAIRYNDSPAAPGVREARGLAPLLPDPDLGDFATELRERLGLRLEAVRAPVDVLVIDRIERPEEN